MPPPIEEHVGVAERSWHARSGLGPPPQAPRQRSMSSTHSEAAGTSDSEAVAVSPQRWYILLSFSLLACLQCLVWNTWGPIDVAVRYAYPSWTDATVAMMSNWGMIMYFVTVVPLCWLLETRGLRDATILVAGLVAMGTVLRTLSASVTSFTVFSHLCAILNGMAGVIIMSAPPALSAVWFPTSQRTTATSINQIFNQLGNAVTFILGPYMVPDTFLTPNSTQSAVQSFSHNATHTPTPYNIRHDIQYYMLAQACAAVLLLVTFVIYFPARPAQPPSPSSAVPRTEFKKGLLDLAQNGNFWLGVFGYALSSGVPAAWLSIMTLNFKPLGIGDTESGYIGLFAVLASCLFTLVFSNLIDHMKKQMKLALVLLLSSGAAFFAWLALLCLKLLPFSKWQLYAATIGGISFNFACGPLFFEYMAELAYPVSEGLVGGFLTVFNNIVGFFFLGLFFIPNMSYAWMNYALVLAMILPIPAVFFSRASYRRLAIDLPNDDAGNGEDHQYRTLVEELPQDAWTGTRA